MRQARILQGDCREVLRGLPAESVHCVVTSPPYYGLRDYKLPPSIWGGSVDCDHVWADVKRTRGLTGGTAASTLKGPLNHQHVGAEHSSCVECGAWRGCLGLEPTPDLFVAHLVEVFQEVRRVLRADGTLWLNMGDSYAAARSGPIGDRSGLDGGQSSQKASHQALNASRPPGKPSSRYRFDLWGLKPKDLMGMPWRVAFALQADGWWLRRDIIWSKPNPMPESVEDRPSTAHEYVFLLTKAATYFYNAEAVREHDSGGDHPRHVLHQPEPSGGILPRHKGIRRAEGRIGAGRNARSVWTIATHPFTDWGETSRQVRVSADEADDGSLRIPSPDCPVHGCLARETIPAGDGHAGGAESHSGGNGSRRALEPPADFSPTDPTRGPDSPVDSSGSPRRAHFRVAIGRNRRSHRTDLAPATTLPCTASAETPCRTGDTPETREPAAQHLDTPVSSSGWAAPGGHPSPGKLDGRSRTPSPSVSSACTCSYENTVTEKISHFATFPPGLAERCIRAGTSERGCCPRCGAWEPGCECSPALPTEPCTVLDPFSGAGTTGLVALRLGRQYIGIELSPEYVEMSRRRLEQDAPLVNEVRAEVAPAAEQLSLGEVRTP